MKDKVIKQIAKAIAKEWTKEKISNPKKDFLSLLPRPTYEHNKVRKL